MESMSMTFFLLRDFSFICFAYFYYLVIHSILFHYIHAFLWILCTPLIIFMFLGWSFLVSCTLFQSWQKGGEIVIWFLFLRFYMLWGELCSFVRGVVLYLVRSCAYLLLSVHWSYDHVYIHCAYLWYIYIYIWWCISSSLIIACVVSFLSLYTCFLLLVHNLLFLFHTNMPWWVLFKLFQKYRLSKSTCHKLSSCKVFQEFVLG